MIYLSYRNIIVNVNKIIDMKKIYDFISNYICESCIRKRQQIKISRHFQFKLLQYLKKLHIDIDESLFLIARDNRILTNIKYNWFDMLFFCFMKKKIVIIVEFVIWTKFQIFKKIKRIIVENELKFNVFKNWFKKNWMNFFCFIYFCTKWRRRTINIHYHEIRLIYFVENSFVFEIIKRFRRNRWLYQKLYIYV